MKKMKSLIILLLLIGGFNNLSAQQHFSTTNLNLREGPSSKSKILTTVPKGSDVNVIQSFSYWCKVSYDGTIGYVSKKFLSKNASDNISDKKEIHLDTKQSAHYYTNTFGEKVQSPTHYDSPPAGASAVCGDGTYSFSRNRRGTCSHHGGVARWL